MPDMKTIQEQVQQRLGELEELIAQLTGEFELLQKIAAVSDGSQARPTSGAPRARRRPAAQEPGAVRRLAASSRSRPRGGGNRGQQALELIETRPGLTAAELAVAMGMKRNYLYRVLPALEKDGKVTKQGKGYHPAGARAAG